MKTPIIIYDKSETNFSKYGLAVLLTADNPKILKRLNAEYTLEFNISIDDELYSYIQYDNFLKIEEQLYIIKRIEENKDFTGRKTATVYAEHVIKELIDGWVEDIPISAMTAHTALSNILKDTRFSADALRIAGTYDFGISRATPAKALNEIINMWGVELKPNNYTVSLYDQIGADRGIHFRYRKNMKRIKRVIDGMQGVITRLHVYGKDGISVSIDSPNINLYPIVKHGTVTFSDIDNITDLQTAGEQFLIGKDKPSTAYIMTVQELKNAIGYDDSETYDIGDIVKVYDEDFGEDKQRIIEYEYYPDEPDNSKVKLANFIPSLEDAVARFEESKRILDKITYKGKINTYWLDGVIDVLNNRFNSAMSNWYTDENGNLIFEALDGSSAMKLAGEGFAISDTKDANSNWVWRTFGTGEGFTADLINAGIINAARVQIGSATSYESGYDPSVKVPKGEKIDNSVMIGDGNGIRVLDSNNVARVILGQYLAGKYGIKVTQGEIFATMIQTAEEGAQDYVKLGGSSYPADILGFKYGKKAFGLHAGYGQPSLVAYNFNTEKESIKMLGNYQVNSDYFGYLGSGTYHNPIGIYLNHGFAGIKIRDSYGIDFDDGNGSQFNFLGTSSTTYIEGALTVYGSKNAIVPTTTQGERLLYSLEMPESKFMDEGLSELNNGVARIELDPIFLETVEPNTMDTPFIVHLTPYDYLELRVKESGSNYFVVEEKSGLNGQFSWQLSATRKGYKNIRLERVDNEEVLTSNWEDDLL